MKTPATLHPASAADLDAIEHLEHGCFDDDAFTRRQLDYLIRKAQGACFVARLDGQIVGYLSLLTPRNTCNARIYSVAVAAQARGHGVGQLLVDQAIAYARTQHRRQVTLEVRTDNTPALALYSRKGFVPDKLLKGYYHDGADARRMVFTLSNDGRE